MAEWEGNPQKDLRAVFSIHPESVTLLATVDSGIMDIKDLKGKRVNIGNPGSGQRQNSIDALEANGLDWEKDIQAEQVKAAEAPGLLQDGRLDAFFYTVGHPSGAFKEATAGATKVRFVSISNADKLVAKYPYYAKSFVPVDQYPGGPERQGCTYLRREGHIRDLRQSSRRCRLRPSPRKYLTTSISSRNCIRPMPF